MVKITKEKWVNKKVIVARDDNNKFLSWSTIKDNKPIEYYKNKFKTSNSFNPNVINSFTLGKAQGRQHKGKMVKSISKSSSN